MLKLSLSIVALASLSLSAIAIESAPAPKAVTVTTKELYFKHRAQLQAKADGCDLILAQELLESTSLPLSKIKPLLKGLKSVFDDAKANRLSCYAETEEVFRNFLASAHNNYISQTDNIQIQRQYVLDKAYSESLLIRAENSRRLLDSIWQDLQLTLNLAEAQGKDLDTVYIEESTETQKYIRQDVSLIMEQDRRQAELEEIDIYNGDRHISSVAYIKLKKSQLYFNRSLMAFEESRKDFETFAIARIYAEFIYASAQFKELFAFSEKLDGLNPKYSIQIKKIYDKAEVIRLDIEGALLDLRNGTFADDLQQWLSVVYEDLSLISTETRKLAQKLEVDRVRYMHQQKLSDALVDKLAVEAKKIRKQREDFQKELPSELDVQVEPEQVAKKLSPTLQNSMNFKTEKTEENTNKKPSNRPTGRP